MLLPVKIFGVLFGLLLFAHAVQAQPRCSVVHYTTEDGLPDNRVICIIKDREGFMWIGTWAGITHFDGQHFITYRSQPGERTNFETNRIIAIVEDASGYLWLRSYNDQLYRFDKKTGQFLFIPDIIKNQVDKISFRYIFATKEGSVWLLTNNHGVFCMYSNGTTAPAYQQFAFGVKGASPLPGNEITLFHADSTGQVWIGTQQGIVLLVRNKAGRYEQQALRPLHVQQQLKHVKEKGNTIWFAGDNGNLIAWSHTTRRSSAPV